MEAHKQEADKQSRKRKATVEQVKDGTDSTAPVPGSTMRPSGAAHVHDVYMHKRPLVVWPTGRVNTGHRQHTSSFSLTNPMAVCVHAIMHMVSSRCVPLAVALLPLGFPPPGLLLQLHSCKLNPFCARRTSFPTGPGAAA